MRVVARAMWPTTEPLLRSAGLASGMRCLDVGCGAGDASLALARIVGTSGSVTGIDQDEIKVQFAREDAERERLSNLRFRASNVEQLEDDAEYDLVYARFLLTHLRDPAAVLRRLVRAARPGGVIVVEDIDHAGVFSHPHSPALETFVGLYNRVVRSRGADPEIGPKLPGLFREVGLAALHLSHVQPVYVDGEAKHIHRITLDNIAPALIAAGFVTAADLEALSRALDAFLSRSDTLVSTPRIFQVWARRSVA
jgi:ubiquinone/menaquinone biosynthesis C-methylase UbiE